MTQLISNLMDAKVEDKELNTFLTECDDDEKHIKIWQRYHCTSALLNSEISDKELKFDVAAKVMQELNVDGKEKTDAKIQLVHDSKHADANKSTMKRWLPTAIAACLLLVVLVLVENAFNGSSEFLPTNLTNHASSNWQAQSQDAENALNALLVEHSEFTGLVDMNGLSSYSKFISYQY